MARLSTTIGRTAKAKVPKVSKTKVRKTAKPTSHISLATKPRKRRSGHDLTRELKEARQQQDATAAILRVINASPGDLTAVFEIILEKTHSLCDVASGSLQLYEDGYVRTVAMRGFNERWAQHLRQGYKIDESNRELLGSVQPRHMADAREVLKRSPNLVGRAFVEIGGFRTFLSLPLLKNGKAIGRIVAAREEVRPFTKKQIALLQSFADQAVIAVENARLFNDTAEALERQTATAEILKVIASSPSDVQPVFEAIAERSKRLLGGFSATVFRFIDGVVNLVAYTPVSHGADAVLMASFPRPTANLPFFELAKRGEVVQEADSETNPDAGMRDIARARGFRSSLFSPLMSKGTPMGLIVVTRKEPGTFLDHHVQLLRTFADQAVIAIENARLFNEVQEALERQTATADVLKVISSSPGELEPVFEVLLSNAVRLCEAQFGVLCTYDGNGFEYVSARNASLEYTKYMQRRGRFQPVSGTMLDRLMRTKQLSHTADEAAELVPGPAGAFGGARSLVGVPLLKNDELRGAIIIYRTEVRPFAEKQIELLTNFAAQAVIAIDNTRLLNELRHRTDDLTRSLKDLHTAQDRLVQTEKLASLGQLTAGIAHEIKNPLNFVNNFSMLSAELTDELNETLKPVAMDGKVRVEVDQLTGMLKDNLQKVVQHGNRADSIVKNMLLHSREGSGEHRPADINSLLDESLNLAYHGARAERGEFNITLQREFAANAGTVELFPQEITRAFLNLISNGVYAATKRKIEGKEPGFEPILRVTTKDLGSAVEIRIRDNGAGISAEVQKKMFNPFFTTKPAGEGTGLGLSMTHDIIVKQHGGRIDVATELGQFTEFTIVLPRMSAVSAKDGGET